MKFIYTPTEDMNDTLTKYDVKFVAGVPVDVTNLKKASKMQKMPYLSVCVETEVVEETPDTDSPELTAARIEYKEVIGLSARNDSKLETLVKLIAEAKQAKEDASD
ncbi:MAG: hypothetical protein V3T88_07855 [Nitrosomonadaceae bacterium]